jgi:uncharacterized membrane protein
MEKTFKNKYFIFGIIIVFALIVRLWGLFCTGEIVGLWYDEMAIYSISSKSFPFGMITEDAHRFLLFPLYFLMYKTWIGVFSHSDLSIRMMSVFFDMGALILAYFIGNFLARIAQKPELASKTALFSALLYSINSSLIYYSQEAKAYAITFFLINLLILAWLKFLQKPNSKNIILLISAKALLLYTYTSQLLLILCLQLITLIYFICFKKTELKNYFKQFLGFILILIPLFIAIILNQGYFSGNFDAVVFDYSFILLAIQNLFSPVLAGLQNNILNYQNAYLANIFNLKWIIFILFPIFFHLTLIVIGVRKSPIAKCFLSVALLYFSIHISLTQTTNYAVLVRYILFILPFLLPIAAFGLAKFWTKKRAKILLCLFLFINIFVLISPISATKIKRPDSYKDLAKVLISSKISPESNFILPIRTSLLDKYYKIKGEKISLYSLNSINAQKTYLSKTELKNIQDKKNLYTNYKKFLLTKIPTEKFKNYVKKEFTNKLKTGKKLVLLKDSSICLYTNFQITQIVNNQNLYLTQPIQFLRLSKLNNDLITILSKQLTLQQIIKAGNWEIYIFSRN